MNYRALHPAMTTAARAEVLSALDDAGTSWVRIPAEWSALQPTSADAWDTTDAVARLDRRIREARLRGLSILLALKHAPEWASGTTAANGRPSNPADFANAVAWLAERYSGSAGSPLLKIDALEMWPEPNKDWAWAAEPSNTRVSSYAELIKAAGPAGREANPNLKMVVGGLNSSDTTWLDQFYDVNGVIGTYDALGLLTYQSPGDATPEAGDEQYAQYFITGMKRIADLMDSKNDPADIWATEFGWTSHDNSGYPDGVPVWALGVSPQTQADFLLRAAAEMKRLSPRITAAFWADATDTKSGDPMKDNYGLVTTDFQRKPVWDAMLCLQTGQCSYVLPGDDWRFQDAGSNLETEWRNSAFDDSGWTVGPTEAGYGDHDEATLLTAGTPQNRALTVYARHKFAVDDPSRSAKITLRLKIDDGAVAYLNGEEVVRFNLPKGEINFQTRATRNISGAEERRWREFVIDDTALKPGENILAVEIHQVSRASDDLSFDAALTGHAPDEVVAGVPGAPTGVSATITRDRATVSWTAPADSGDSEITQYEARSVPGGMTCTGSDTSCSISGLTPGQTYVFVVRAQNGEGSGPFSTPSNPVGSAGVPAAPPEVRVEAGFGVALIAWARPHDGGSPLVSYTVESMPEGFGCTVQVSERQPFCLIRGLTNGEEYQFAVHATNALGDGPAALTDKVTPLGLPGAPSNAQAVAGDGQATVTWSPATVTNGAPISGYRVVSSPGQAVCTTETTTCVVNGLTNGTTYTFTVRALNSLGLGRASEPSNSVIPAGDVPPPDPQPETELVFGVNYQPLWEKATDELRAEQLEALAEVGTKWVRIDVSWSMLEPNGPGQWDMGWGVPRIDQRIREIKAHGMNILLMLYWAPEWSSGTSSKTGRPSDPQDYANAAAWVAKRYDGKSVESGLKVDAIQILNEPNISGFWQQEPAETRVSSVADIVRLAGPAIKAANPEMLVATWGTSYVDTPWWTEFYENPGVIGTYDILAVNPYQSPGDAPPEAYDPNWAQYYLRHLESMVALMEQKGDPAVIWASEYGWTSHDNSTYPEGVPPYAKGVTEAQQAEYLPNALEVMREISPRIQGAFWYNTWEGNSGDAMQDNFGLLNVDLSPKPAFDAFACVIENGRPDPC